MWATYGLVTGGCHTVGPEGLGGRLEGVSQLSARWKGQIVDTPGHGTNLMS